MASHEKKIHYAWKIVIACILMKLGTAGALSAAIGNFVAPIVDELHCEVSQLTMYISINAITMALLYTTAARMLTKKHIGLVMGISSIGEVVGLALMSTYHSVYGFYLSGLIVGVSQAFTGLIAIPIVLNMWFKKKNGTVLGLVLAVGTVATIFYTILSAHLITTFGWRQTYMIMAVMAAVITLPAVFLLVKTPEEVGCLPYGAEEEECKAPAVQSEMFMAPTLTSKEAFRMPMLYVAWIACILYSYACGVAGYVTPFITMELGQSISFGAAVSTACSLGGACSSLIVGRINDKYGVKQGMLWGTVTTAVGYLGLMLAYGNTQMAYPAALIVGLGASMYGVQCPLLAQKIVGSGNFSEIWARMMMVNSLIGGGLYSSIGLFYDKLGSFRAAFIMAIVCYTVAGLLGILAINMKKSRKQDLAV